MHMRECVRVNVYVCMSTSIFKWIRTCRCVLWICACMIHVCVGMCILCMLYIHKGVHVWIMYACMRVCACVTCRLVTYVCMHACMYMYDVHMCLHTYVHWWKHMYMICILLSSHHHLFFLRQSWNDANLESHVSNACASNRRHSKQHPTGLWTRKKRVRNPCALTKTKRCWLNTLAEKTSETFFSCGRAPSRGTISPKSLVKWRFFVLLCRNEGFLFCRNPEWRFFFAEIRTRTISRAPSRRNH